MVFFFLHWNKIKYKWNANACIVGKLVAIDITAIFYSTYLLIELTLYKHFHFIVCRWRKKFKDDRRSIENISRRQLNQSQGFEPTKHSVRICYKMLFTLTKSTLLTKLHHFISIVLPISSSTCLHSFAACLYVFNFFFSFFFRFLLPIFASTQ